MSDRWQTNPDGSATLPIPEDVPEHRSMSDEYPEWVCAECGRSLFRGPVYAGKGDVFQPPFATCSPQHGRAQGSTLYEGINIWREDLNAAE